MLFAGVLAARGRLAKQPSFATGLSALYNLSPGEGTERRCEASLEERIMRVSRATVREVISTSLAAQIAPGLG